MATTDTKFLRLLAVNFFKYLFFYFYGQNGVFSFHHFLSYVKRYLAFQNMISDIEKNVCKRQKDPEVEKVILRRYNDDIM